MATLRKVILASSIALNIATVFVAGYVIHQKGGLTYIKNRAGTLSGMQTSMDESFYNEKVRLFRSLPRSADSTVFLGDSITADGEWAEIFQNGKIKNRGIPLDNTAGVLKRLNEVIELKPAKVFLLIGINDLGSGRSAQEIIANYDKILGRLKEETPHTTIVVQSILPVNYEKYSSVLFDNKKVAECNSGIKLLAQKYNLKYVDINSLMLTKDGQMNASLTTDGVHLNSDGYKVWSSAISGFVN